MKDFLNRNIVALAGGLAAVVIGLLVVVAILLGRTAAHADELAALRADLERVESGTAVFAGQITAFQGQLAELAPTVRAALDEAIAELEAFQTSTLDFAVAIDEVIPIDSEILFERTLTVPIQTSLPIDETIATTITIAGPFGIDIPVDVTVPVNLTVPIDLDLDFPVSERVPIQSEVPVQLSVPITVEVAETELATLAGSLRQGLIGFREVIDGLG